MALCCHHVHQNQLRAAGERTKDKILIIHVHARARVCVVIREGREKNALRNNNKSFCMRQMKCSYLCSCLAVPIVYDRVRPVDLDMTENTHEEMRTNINIFFFLRHISL